jgi:transcriptional regulator with XRE-family HTH domain
MEDYDSELGPFFRHIRKRRGLKIRDVASGVSETTLSRFERGQIDLTIAKLAPAVEAAEIDPEDLLLQSNQATKAFAVAQRRIEAAIVTGDIEEAEVAYRTYQTGTQHLQLPLRTYNLLMLKYAVAYIRDPLVRMSGDDEKLVVDFLTRDDDWHRFEYNIVQHLIYFMDGHAAERCLRLMRRSFMQRRHPDDDSQAYHDALLNAIRRPLADHNLAIAEEIAEMLSTMSMSPTQPEQNYRRKLYMAVLSYIKAETNINLEAIQQLVDALALAGSCQLASSTANWLITIGIPLRNFTSEEIEQKSSAI